MRTRVAVVGAFVLLLAACGGGDSADDRRRDEYIIGAAEGLAGSEDVPPSVSQKDLDCLATGVVDSVGVAALEQAGITPADLKADDNVLASLELDLTQARGVADAFFDCVDTAAVLAENLDVGVPGFDTDCAAEQIAASDTFRDVLARSLSGDTDLAFDEQQARAVAEDFVTCVDFAEAFLAEVSIDLTGDESACIRNGVEDVPTEPLVDGLTQSLMGQDPETGAVIRESVSAALLECLPLPKLAQLGLGT